MTRNTLILAVALTAADVLGQGTAAFYNTGASAVTNRLSGGRLAPGTTWKAALYWAPDGGSVPPLNVFTQVGDAVEFGPVPGCFRGGVRTTPDRPGAPAYFQVRVWEAAFGQSYEQAIAAGPHCGGRYALVGTSAIVRLAHTGDPNASPHLPPPSLAAAGLRGFTIFGPLSWTMPRLDWAASNHTMTLSWTSSVSCHTLEAAPALPTWTNWVAMTNAVQSEGNRRWVTVEAVASNQFYRLNWR